MHVAVGIIFNAQREVLIAKRLAHQYKGGLWEFPGGKVEAGETVFAALQRELHEEIGVKIIHAEPWLKVPYDYQDRQVLLDTWLVTQLIGEPVGQEGQDILWVKPRDLNQFQFPDGNQPIIDKLLLI